MGFPFEKAKKVIESSQSTVLNDLIDLIIKDMQENPDAETPNIQAKKEYTAYECEACTFLNQDNPGPFCQVCGNKAPKFAEKCSKEEPVALSMA